MLLGTGIVVQMFYNTMAKWCVNSTQEIVHAHTSTYSEWTTSCEEEGVVENEIQTGKS